MIFLQYENFLKDAKAMYNSLPIKEKNIMDILGISHLENIYSNILAFYLNPKEEHKLSDLFIKSLLTIINKKGYTLDNINTLNFKVYREYLTSKGNRIDIILQNEDYAIGIENKINAGVYNDLEDYSNTIDMLNKNSLKILLTLHEENKIALNNGWINITYKEFFQEIENNLKGYKNYQDKWYVFLKDFMESLKGVSIKENMEVDINNWINNHKDEIRDFNNLLNIAKENINKRINMYVSIFEEEIDKNDKIRYYYGEGEISTTAYVVFDSGYNLDVKLSTENWNIGIFIWKKSNQFKIRQLLNENSMQYIEENNHLWIKGYEYTTDIAKIASDAFKLYNLLKSL